MSSPTAFAATSADVSLPNADDNSESAWKPDGVSGDTQILLDGKILVPVGTATKITREITLPKGNYTYTITGNNNAKVSFSGTGMTNDAENNGFTLSEESTTVTITVEASDVSKEFGFDEVSLTLQFDFDTEKYALIEELNGLTLESCREGDESEAATKLNEDKASLEEEIGSLKTAINAIESTIESYRDNKFYNETNAFDTKIDDLSNKIETYNKAVEAENRLFDTKTSAEAYYKTLSGNQQFASALTWTADEKDGKDNTNVASYIREHAIDEETGKSVGDVLDARASLLDDLEKAIEDPTDYTSRNFEDEYNDLISDWNIVVVEFRTARSDAEAYYNERVNKDNKDLGPKSDAVETAKVEAEKAINELEKVTVNGEESPVPADVYDEYMQAQLAAISDKYAEAEAILAPEEDAEDPVKGAYDRLDAYNKAADENAAAITAIATDYCKLVQTQEQNKADADAYISEKETEIATLQANATTLPEQYATDYADAVRAAAAAVSELKAAVQDDYNNHKLEVISEDTKTEIENKISAINNLVGEIAPIVDLIEQLNAAKEEIEKNSADLAETVDIPSKFEGNYRAIESSIKALDKAVTEESDEYNSIKTAIDNAKDAAGKLIEAFNNVISNQTTCQEEYTGYKEFVDETKYAADSEFKAAYQSEEDGDYQTLKTTYEGFATRLTNAAEANAQDCYNAATALAKDMESFANEVADARATYAHDATEASFKYAEDQLDVVTKLVSDNQSATGINDVEIPNLDDITINDTDDEETLGATDEKIKDALKNIGVAKAAVEGVIANQEAYDELKKAADKIGGDLGTDEDGNAVLNEIQEISNYNQENSNDPAKTYYDNLINGDGEDSFLSRYNEIKSEMDAALADQKAVEQKETIEGKLSNLSDDIDNLYGAILDNEDSHKTHVATADDVRKAIESARTGIEKLDQNESTEGWLETLDELDRNLVTVTGAEAAAYAKGASKENDSEFNTAIDEIRASINDVLGAKDGYSKEVIDANNNLFNGSWTVAYYDELENLYNKATSLLQQYTNKVNNDGYRAALSGIWDSHKDVRDYLDQINDLNKRAGAELTKANEPQTVDDSEELYPSILEESDLAEVISEAESLKTALENKISAITNDIDGIAANYYSTQLTAAEAVIDNAEKALKDAGVVLEKTVETTDEEGNVTSTTVVASEISNEIGLTAAKTSVKLAEFLKTAIDNSASEETPLLLREIMDDSEISTGISGLLDLVLAENAIDLQKGAERQWASDYAAADKELGTLAADLNKYSDFASEEDVETFNTIREVNVPALDATASGHSSDLIDNLKDLKDSLESELQDARGIVQAAGNAYDDNETNNTLLNGYNTQAGELDSAYEALRRYVGSLGANTDLSSVEASISAAKSAVKENKADLDAVKNYIDAAFTAAAEAIDAAYIAEAKAEVEYFKVMITRLSAASNEANAEALKLEGDAKDAALTAIEALNETAGEYATTIGEYGESVDADDFDAETAQEMEADFLAMESNLSELLVNYKTSWTDSPVDDVVAALGESYDSVKEAIDAAAEYLSSCLEVVQQDEKFKDAYAGYQSDLDAIAAKWADNDASLIMQQENLENEMAALKAAVEETDAAVKAAQAEAADAAAKQEANEARYAELAGQIEAIRADYNAAKDRVDAYAYANAEFIMSYTESIDNAIESIAIDLETANSEDRLVEKNDKGEYVATSYALTGTEDVNNMIYALVYICTNAEVNGSISEAEEALAAAAKALAGQDGNKVLPAVVEEQQAELAKLQAAFDAIDSDWTNVEEIEGEETEREYYQRVFDNADAIVEAAAKIAEAAGAISDTAVENSYLPGDLDNDGTVDVFDIQKLIGYISNDEQPTDATEFAAADMNGDKQINIADLTMVISAARGESSTARLIKRAGLLAAGRQGSDIVAVEKVSTSDGISRFAISIANSADVTAGQIDVILPAGMSITSVEAAGRLSDHELFTADNANGMRVVVASMENTSIEGRNGAVIYVDATGDGTIGVDNVIFADSCGESYRYEKAPGTSGIDDIATDARPTIKERIYNAAGQMMNRIQRGINIIRHSDGSTTKEYRK